MIIYDYDLLESEGKRKRRGKKKSYLEIAVQKEM